MRRRAGRAPRPAARVDRVAGPLLTLLALALAEALLWLVPPSGLVRAEELERCAAPGWCGPSRRVRRLDPVVGYANRAGADEFVPLAEHPGGGYRFRTDGLGLRRDGEVAVPKPAGVLRVLVLGDSQIEGYVDNDEHYPHLLEERLRSPGGGRVEVLNAAVGGYGPLQYYLWYRAAGERLEPDLVVVHLYVGNDFWDVMNRTTEELPSAALDAHGDPRLAPLWPADYAQHWTRKWLRDHSRLFDLARLSLAAIERWRAPPVDAERALRLSAECHGCLSQHFLQIAQGSPDLLARARADSLTLLALMRRQVEGRGARFVVVLVPTKAQVEPQDARAEAERAAAVLQLGDEQRRSNDRLYRVALAAAGEAGIPVIDSWPALAAGAAAERLYYRRDWHLNPAGHRVLAESVAAALVGGGHIG
jgi:lysophospholipase L1-like esterase